MIRVRKAMTFTPKRIVKRMKFVGPIGNDKKSKSNYCEVKE
jgi:hypothetical protein